MKKATNKILSFLTAFAMVIGVLVAPFASANADETTTPQTPTTVKQDTKSVTVHKIVMDKASFDGFTEGTKGKDDTEYVSTEIENKDDYFLGKPVEGQKRPEGVYAKEVAGVRFKMQKPAANVDTPDVKNDSHWTDLGEGFDDVTGDNGLTFNTENLPVGTYRIVEIHEGSTYVGPNGETITAGKAVPLKIDLPLANEQGGIEEAHVYPKNTEEKPTTNKDFSDEFKEGQQGRDENVQEDTQTSNPTDKTKDVRNKSIGDHVDYTVRTTVPANAKYASAYWDDKMTEGLTYDRNLKITLDGKTLVPGSDYKLTETDRGFRADLTEKGLKKVNNQSRELVLLLTYSATINGDVVNEESPESNDVTFHYGNNPNKGNTPIPSKPNDDGELKVAKTWDDKKWAEGEEATFRLVDAQTGKTVTGADLVKPDNISEEEFKTIRDNFKAEQNIGYNKNGGEAVWKYLDKNKEYKAIEINMTPGTESEYVKAEDGTITVVNHKTNNPQPINPTEPKVVSYKKRFVKRDKNTDERLPGAQFVVSRGEGQNTEYLVYANTENLEKAVNDARTELENAVNAYNNLPENATEAEINAALARFEQAQTALNQVIKANVPYSWTKDQNDAHKFESDADGKVEVIGLPAGDYSIVEVKAPEGYALPANASWPFKVGPEETNDDYYETSLEKTAKTENAKKDNDPTKKSVATDATRIDNTLISIPQTGGIGSLIFYVVGAGIVIAAIVAMKRRNAVEA